MKSLVTKCLALGIVSMCVLGTAHAQQVPPEFRGRLQTLQEREQALLKARNLYLDLLNDHENLLIQIRVDGGGLMLPFVVPRTNLTTAAILGAVIATEISVQQRLENILRIDRAVRQEIQQARIPEIDKALAHVRSEFDTLMAQAGGRRSAVAPTAASGSLVVSGELDQADVDRRNHHLLKDFGYKASSYDAGSVTLEILPPAASGRPFTARITGQVDFKRHLLHPTRPGEQFEEWWDVTVTLGPGQGTLDRLEGPASAIEDYRSKAPDRSTRNSYNNERWHAARQPDGSYRLTMPGISDGVPFLLRAR
jgi:hypothetical protein